jgi:hypothetical protein
MATGVSVLLASKSEGVNIELLESAKKEVLRVGKWHAKDKEEDEPFNFENVIASMRTGNVVPEPVTPTSHSLGRDLVFVMGERDAIQDQTVTLNQRFPLADIVRYIMAVLIADWDLTFPNTNEQLFTDDNAIQWRHFTFRDRCIIPHPTIHGQEICLANV